MSQGSPWPTARSRSPSPSTSPQATLVMRSASPESHPAWGFRARESAARTWDADRKSNRKQAAVSDRASSRSMISAPTQPPDSTMAKNPSGAVSAGDGSGASPARISGAAAQLTTSQSSVDQIAIRAVSLDNCCSFCLGSVPGCFRSFFCFWWW